MVSAFAQEFHDVIDLVHLFLAVQIRTVSIGRFAKLGLRDRSRGTQAFHLNALTDETCEECSENGATPNAISSRRM